MCNCLNFDAQAELWLRFGGPWSARMQARAQLEHKLIDSITVFCDATFQKYALVENLMLRLSCGLGFGGHGSPEL